MIEKGDVVPQYSPATRGSIGRMERGAHRSRVTATYLELAPCAALQAHVRAFFSFTPGPAPESGLRPILRRVVFTEGDPYSGPMLATAEASIVVGLGTVCLVGDWVPAGEGCVAPHLVGPTTRAAQGPPGRLPAMVGAYLRPAHLARLTRLPASTLTDRIIPLGDVLGSSARDIVHGFERLGRNGVVDDLERALLCRFRSRPEARSRLDVPGLCAWVNESGGCLTVDEMAASAGVTRQHLTREFGKYVGLPPKVYGRLARFHAALRRVARGAWGRWAEVAVTVGYSDQSHMIAEFRTFSGLTPGQLATDPLFHPFLAGR